MSETPGLRRMSARKLFFRFTKLAVSLCIHCTDVMVLAAYRLVQKQISASCAVLYYHSIPDKYVEKFTRQMELVKSVATPIDLRNMEGMVGSAHYVGITFDDSLESFFKNGIPVLVQLQIPATVFAVSGALGTSPSWGEFYYSPDERIMSVDQLLIMPSLITVGSHTVTHPNLAALPRDEASREISCSRKELEGLICRPIQFFSFPFGIYDSGNVRQCREAGYERVFTTEPVVGLVGDYTVGRFAADPWDWQLELYLKIMGAYRWQKSARTIVHRVQRLFTTEK